MGIIHWDPLDELALSCESFDLIVGEALGAAVRAGARTPCWAPSVEMFETAGEVVVRATMPGIDPQTLHITVSGDRVVLVGKARVAPDQRGRGELRYGIVRRAVMLPAAVHPGTARATYRDGLLELRMDKAPWISPSVVTVKADLPLVRISP